MIVGVLVNSKYGNLAMDFLVDSRPSKVEQLWSCPETL